jgi:hypothetical protein
MLQHICWQLGKEESSHIHITGNRRCAGLCRRTVSLDSESVILSYNTALETQLEMVNETLRTRA